MLSGLVKPNYPVVLEMPVNFFEPEFCKPAICERDAIHFFYLHVIDGSSSPEPIKIIIDALGSILHFAPVGKVEQ